MTTVLLTLVRGLLHVQEDAGIVLRFIVGCLEELRAEDAAAARMPDAPATGVNPSPPAEADTPSGAAAAVSLDSQAAAAQQGIRPSEDATGAAVAPHKQAPFAGA